MNGSLSRIGAMALRYLYLHKRSLPRTFEIVFWPVMELLLWGFVSVYLKHAAGDALASVGAALINAMIFWDVLYRSQQGVSVSFVEDIWTQSIVNLLISPLRIWEWITATFVYGVLKTGLITLILGTLALGLYRYDMIGTLHLQIVPLVFNLLLFGWALGIFTAALIIRYGHSAEALIWGIPFLVQPLSAIFYPLSTLPGWLQHVSRALPSTYVFEGMRAVITQGAMPAGYFWTGLALNLFYFALAGLFFGWMHSEARKAGRLGRLGMD